MALTLLIDLDDTLIGNPMDVFIPAYLKAMGNHMEKIVPPTVLIPSMLDATQSMFFNKRPDRTLKDTFDAHFFPTLGIPENTLRPLIDKFYQNIFPSLQRYTENKQDALELIKTALKRGDHIGIATNPVFPKTAIIQRLQWAGFSVDEYPFVMVPSYETFHFAKPDPAFFAEFLTQIGWPENPVIMIGNDLDHDIRGSALFGISSFWISQEGEAKPPEFPEPDGRGELSDFFHWLDSQDLEKLIPEYNTPTAMIAILRGGPAGMATTLSGINEAEWTKRPQKNEWCLTEIICHLRDVELEVNLPRLNKILKEENPFISGIDSDKWAEERGYIKQDGLDAFEKFISGRIETLEILEGLDTYDWGKEVRHAIFGPTNLKEIIYFMTGHEILHDRQAYEVIQLFLPHK